MPIDFFGEALLEHWNLGVLDSSGGPKGACYQFSYLNVLISQIQLRQHYVRNPHLVNIITATNYIRAAEQLPLGLVLLGFAWSSSRTCARDTQPDRDMVPKSIRPCTSVIGPHPEDLPSSRPGLPTSTSRLPFKTPEIPTNRGRKAHGRDTLGM